MHLKLKKQGHQVEDKDIKVFVNFRGQTIGEERDIPCIFLISCLKVTLSAGLSYPEFCSLLGQGGLNLFIIPPPTIVVESELVIPIVNIIYY